MKNGPIDKAQTQKVKLYETIPTCGILREVYIYDGYS